METQHFKTNVYVWTCEKKKMRVCVHDLTAGCASERSAAGGGSLGVRSSSWGDFRRGWARETSSLND